MVKADYEALLHNLLDGRDAAVRVLERAEADGELDPEKTGHAKFLVREGFTRAVEALGEKPPADE